MDGIQIIEDVFQSSVLRSLHHGQYLNSSNVAAKQDARDGVAAPTTICPALLSVNAIVETVKTGQGRMLQIVTAIDFYWKSDELSCCHGNHEVGGYPFPDFILCFVNNWKMFPNNSLI